MTRHVFQALIFSFGFSILGLPVQSAPAAEAPARTIIVLDASGSMWGKVKGRAKIEIAREVIADLVKKLPEDTELGLVAYGHRRKGDCADIELLVSPARLDREAFIGKVEELKPQGMTPLTHAVEFAARELAHTEHAATVVLVTDGEETCDRDPCAAAEALEKAGVKFTAHVVAFDLDAKAAKSVECFAKKTGGLFLRADDAASLGNAIGMALEPEAAEPAADPGQATVSPPKAVVAGADFQVAWTGPNHLADFLVVVPAGSPDDTPGNYAYTRGGSPLALTAPIGTGAAEVRYIHSRSGKVLASAPINVEKATVSLNSVKTAAAGSKVQVEWTGPNHPGDFITIVSKGTEDGQYASYGYTRDGSPLAIETPLEHGPAEIRYMAGQGNAVLHRIPIELSQPEFALKAAESAVAGSLVEVRWVGPSNERDYITIVPKTAPDGQYLKYTYTTDGSPLKVPAPMEAGDAEIRYMSGQGDKVLFRTPIRIIAAEVSLKAEPETVPAGGKVTITWTGPNNGNDYITIVPKDAEDGTYQNYTYTKEGSPLAVIAPDTAGPCEIRYMAGDGDRVLARHPLTVTAAAESKEE